MSLGLGVAPRAIRGGCTPGNSRPWQLASLVLIGPSAHVRGPVPGLSIRALGRQATLAPVRTTSARPRGVAPRAIRAFGSWSPVGTVQDRPSRQARRSLRSCSSGRQRTSAAQCLGSQFAPWGGKLRLCLCEPLAHVHGGGYLPGKHAAWQRRTIRAFGSWSLAGTVQDRPSRQARRSLRSCSSIG